MTVRLLARAVLIGLPFVAGCSVLGLPVERTWTSDRWPQGLVEGRGTVHGGLQQGSWTFWDDQGRVRAVADYVDDELNGKWESWFPGGQSEQEGRYEDEQRTGLWRYWHEGGAPRSQGRFQAGREVGEWTFWNERGVLVRRGSFDEGLATGHWVTFGSDGVRRSDGSYWRGQQVGPWRELGADGQPVVLWYPAPDSRSWSFARDAWEDGQPRREGFLVDGRREGPWVLRHRNGLPRLIGNFEQGDPVGRWQAFDLNGEPVAEGELAGSRPTGIWEVVRGESLDRWDTSGGGPPLTFDGRWSEGRELDTRGLEEVLPHWVAEHLAPLPSDALFALAPTAASDSIAEAPSEPAPEAPVQLQPWTQRELDDYEEYVELYTSGPKATPISQGLYGSGGWEEAEAELGDVERAAEFIGRPLPMTQFRGPQGQPFDLSSLRGKRVVLVILRGFNGGVCVYCTAQTRAFSSADAFRRFEELGASLQVVYPGGVSSFEAFRSGFQSLNDAELPPYGLLYQHDTVVGDSLGLEGEKVIPTTFVIDEEGLVRYAYVGLHQADRPSVDLICEQLSALGPQG